MPLCGQVMVRQEAKPRFDGWLHRDRGRSARSRALASGRRTPHGCPGKEIRFASATIGQHLAADIRTRRRPGRDKPRLNAKERRQPVSPAAIRGPTPNSPARGGIFSWRYGYDGAHNRSRSGVLPHCDPVSQQPKSRCGRRPQGASINSIEITQGGSNGDREETRVHGHRAARPWQVEFKSRYRG
jgi:hypothetical protein